MPSFVRKYNDYTPRVIFVGLKEQFEGKTNVGFKSDQRGDPYHRPWTEVSKGGTLMMFWGFESRDARIFAFRSNTPYEFLDIAHAH